MKGQASYSIVKAWCFRVLLVWLLPTAIQAEDRVAFIYDDDVGNYHPILKGFREYTRKQAGRIIQTDILNADQLSTAELRHKLASNYQLVITLGAKTTRLMASYDNPPPIFAIQVAQSELRALHKQANKEGHYLTGIFRDQPFHRQAALIKAALPEHRKVGLLLSQKTKTLKPLFDASFRRVGLKPIVTIVRNNDIPQRVMEKLAIKSDVIIAIFDDKLYAPENVKSHLLAAFRHQRPFVGVTRGYTEIGAIAAIYTDNYELGKQTGSEVLRIIDDKGSAKTPSYPNKFLIKMNSSVARSLGIKYITDSNLYLAVSKSDDQLKKN
ncbi:ABC transporter substrate-binding protein [Pleionea sp. CnH1-48]|uniref:ABC transporter substrate-binding protein n=1 Tax=Pleionea sp. CnH1-48 TaxID=2954494 RepID=UPI002097C8E7|nr:ABC transporter substrate binding protein [Pleionea sp. CnH1-48]MCO7223893.1 hypothetical protein [Pleionea sp. CnH1-48]